MYEWCLIFSPVLFLPWQKLSSFEQEFAFFLVPRYYFILNNQFIIGERCLNSWIFCPNIILYFTETIPLQHLLIWQILGHLIILSFFQEHALLWKLTLIPALSRVSSLLSTDSLSCLFKKLTATGRSPFVTVFAASRASILSMTTSLFISSFSLNSSSNISIKSSSFCL